MGDNTDEDDDCMDGKGLIEGLKDCMSPDGESGVEERED